MSNAGGYGTAFRALGGALEVTGALEQGKFEANSYERSARINELNAQTAAIETAMNETTARRQATQRLSRQLAAQGEAGIGGQTFADLSYIQSVGSETQDILNLRYKGLAEVEQYRNQAIMDLYNAKAAKKRAKLMAWTAGINTAADVLSMGSSSGLFATKGK